METAYKKTIDHRIEQLLEYYSERIAIIEGGDLTTWQLKAEKDRLNKAISNMIGVLTELFNEPDFTQNDKSYLFISLLNLNKKLKSTYRIPLHVEITEGNLVFPKDVGFWDVLAKNGFIKPYHVRDVKFKADPNSPIMDAIFSEVVGDDGLRPAMTGVNFDNYGITATNAHILLHVAIDTKEYESAIYKLPNALRKEYKSFIKNINETEQSYPLDKYLEHQAKIDAKYPNYEAIVPKRCEGIQLVNLAMFYSALKNISTLKFYNNVTKQIYINVADDNGDVTNFSFNLDFLLIICESLMKLGILNAQICYSERSRAWVITKEGVDYYNIMNETFGLIMPVMNSYGGFGVTIDIREKFNYEVNFYGEDINTVSKSDIFSSSIVESAKKQVESKKPELVKKDDSKEKNQQNERKFLMNKIAAFDDMIALTDDKDEKRYLVDKIDAFSDMLEVA